MAANVTVRRVGGWTMSGTSGLRASGKFGSAPAGSLSIQTGTGSAQCDQIYVNSFSIATTATLAIDLRGGSGELDINNLTLSLQKVRWLYVELTTPAASTWVQVGPQNQSNAWQGPWGGVTATYYSVVPHIFDQNDPYNVWPVVDATHKMLAIYNPGAATVAGKLVIAGVHS